MLTITPEEWIKMIQVYIDYQKQYETITTILNGKIKINHILDDISFNCILDE